MLTETPPIGNARPHSATGVGRWVGYTAIAVVVQVPLFLGLYLQTGTDMLNLFQIKEDKRMSAALVRIKREPEKKPEIEIEPEGQIVEVPDLPEPEVIEPIETKRLADRTTRVKKETRSRVTARPDRSRRAGRIDVKDPSEVQSPTSDSPEPTVTDKDEEKVVELQKPEEKLPKADKGILPKDSVLHQGDRTRLLLPSTTEKAAIANLQALSGTFATDDHLPEVEPGKSTLLNANKYKYADFFYRVKDAVRRHWHPNRVYRRRDPTGKVYGVKDRHTVLAVTLDDAGRLKKLVTKKHSGLDFMDDEARSAFKRASPFPNPPKGLVNDRGEVNFEFGFYFEISSGRYKFRWRRM